jgi:DNA-binding winged helix-turn-helix (wHTH) protein/tetratricopeptide (TPR) repeat protein
MSRIGESAGFMLGEWRVEIALGRIVRDGDAVRIDPRNMKVLQLLASRPGALVTQGEIETTVWHGLVVTPNSVYQSVAQLRRALGDGRTRLRYIETISRKGYRLIAPVTPLAETDSAFPAPVETRSRSPRSWAVGLAASLTSLAVIAGSFAIYDRSTSAGTVARVPGPLLGGSLTSLGGPLNDSAVRVETHFALAAQAWRHGQHQAARRHLEQASVEQRAVSGYRHPSMGVILTQLANARRWGGDYAAAELLAREAIKIFASSSSDLGAGSVRATMALGDALIDGDKHEEAAVYVERALSDARRLYGDNHDLTIDALHSLALLRLAQGRLDEAEQLARRTRDGFLRLHSDGEITTKYPYALALVLYEQGRFAEAAAEARREADPLSRMNPRHLTFMAVAQHVLGRSLNKLGRCEEAERVFRAELQDRKDTQAPRWRVARASSGLGESLLGQGRLGEAQRQLTFAAQELAEARGWLPRQAMQATQERLEQLREAQRMQQVQHAQTRESN